MKNLLIFMGISFAAAFLGGCPWTPACKDDAACAGGEYCEKGRAHCGGEGVCNPRPQACTKELRPVCGCDGRTYDNPCLAAVGGTSVAGDGACQAQAACKTNADCRANTHYCAKAAGDCGGAGQCAARPMACDAVYDPVCGCDGKTYGNACEAAIAGVNAAAKGECKAACAVDKDCPAGSVCEMDTGCVKPMICVKGCHVDGDCGMGMACERPACKTCPCPGTCRAVTPACKSNADCPANTHYCEKAAGDCGGAGKCAARPIGCDKILDPVCGCDGVTYGNACMAAAAGVSVAAKGACKRACTVDKDCPAGQVCELGMGCTKPMQCVPGCHADSDCAMDQKCAVRMCLTCPCPGACQ